VEEVEAVEMGAVVEAGAEGDENPLAPIHYHCPTTFFVSLTHLAQNYAVNIKLIC